MAFNIVPVHSFSDHADYYLIKVTGSTDPSKQYAHHSNIDGLRAGSIVDGLGTKWKAPGLRGLINDNILGYNRYLWYEARVKSGNNTVGTITKHAPETLNNSTKKSNGFTFSLDGNISGSIGCKDGKVESKADISIKPSWRWESKEEYTVNDYYIANQCGGQKASWKWEFQLPKNGPQGLDGVWLEDVPLSGRSSVSLNSEFVMQVKQDEWKKYPNLKLVVDSYSQEGGTEGGGAIAGIGNAGRRDYTYNWER